MKKKNKYVISKGKFKKKPPKKTKKPPLDKVDYFIQVGVFSIIGYNYLILFFTFAMALLPIFQVLIILGCLVLEMFIVRHYWRGIKARIDESKIPSMAQALLDSVSQDELIVYKSATLSNKKEIHITMYSVVACVIVAILIAIFVVTPDIHDNFDFKIAILIFFLTLFPMLLIISVIGMRTLYNDMITQIRFLITDKSIHITKQRHQKRYDVGFIKLSEINAYRFYKRPLDNRGDRGSIIIFYDQYFISLKLINIPHFSSFQKTFESIIFHFSGIVHKDKGEKATSEFKLPIVYQISTKQLRLIGKYIKKIIQDNFLIFIVSFTACFLIAVLISFLIPIMSLVFIRIMIPSLILLTGLLPLIRITRIKKRTNKKESTLELYPDHVILKNDDESNKIDFNFNTCLDFVKIYTSAKRPKERFDTVVIKERFDSKSKMDFF